MENYDYYLNHTFGNGKSCPIIKMFFFMSLKTNASKFMIRYRKVYAITQGCIKGSLCGEEKEAAQRMDARLNSHFY